MWSSEPRNLYILMGKLHEFEWHTTTGKAIRDEEFVSDAWSKS